MLWPVYEKMKTTRTEIWFVYAVLFKVFMVNLYLHNDCNDHGVGIAKSGMLAAI